MQVRIYASVEIYPCICIGKRNIGAGSDDRLVFVRERLHEHRLERAAVEIDDGFCFRRTGEINAAVHRHFAAGNSKLVLVSCIRRVIQRLSENESTETLHDTPCLIINPFGRIVRP